MKLPLTTWFSLKENKSRTREDEEALALCHHRAGSRLTRTCIRIQSFSLSLFLSLTGFIFSLFQHCACNDVDLRLGLSPPPPLFYRHVIPLFRSHLEVKVVEGVSVTEEKFRVRKCANRIGSVEILRTMCALRSRHPVRVLDVQKY